MDFYFVKHNLIQNTVIPRVTDVPIHESKSDYEYDFWTNFVSFHDWWLLSWKHPLPLPHNRWVKALLLTINLEKLGFSLKGSLNAFKNAWRLLLIHIESLSSLSVDVMVEPLGFRHIFISAGVIPLHKIFPHQIYFRGRKLNLFFLVFINFFYYYYLLWFANTDQIHSLFKKNIFLFFLFKIISVLQILKIH